MTTLDAFKTYLAVKMHFKGKYDFFKYSGKVRANQESLKSRRDFYKFEKLARHLDPIGILAANLSRNPDAWIGEIIDGDFSDDRYMEYITNTQSFSYLATKDLMNMKSESLNQLVFNSSSKPELMISVLSNKVSLEVAAALDTVLHFSDTWKGYGPSTDKLALRIKSYGPFIRRVVPVTSLMTVMKKIYDENGIKKDF